MESDKSFLPDIVSADAWKSAHQRLLKKEKELTKLRDELNAERRRMPIVEVDKVYEFKDENGSKTLLELFQGRRQLIVYHFMFAPEWAAGCEGCSWVRDAMTHPAHLHARDTSLVMISRAEYEKLAAYQRRMKWNSPIPWVSTNGNDFNYDFGATTEDGEQHGVSIFIRDGEKIFRSYYVGARGVEYLGTQWSYLDLTPFGRQEFWESSPHGRPQSEAYRWCHRHDEYNL